MKVGKEKPKKNLRYQRIRRYSAMTRLRLQVTVILPLYLKFYIALAARFPARHLLPCHGPSIALMIIKPYAPSILVLHRQVLTLIIRSWVVRSNTRKVSYIPTTPPHHLLLPPPYSMLLQLISIYILVCILLLRRLRQQVL